MIRDIDMLKMIVIIAVCGVIYFLHRIFLWLEKNGFLYYINKKSESGFLAGTLEQTNSLLNPAVKHTIEMKQNQVIVDHQKAGDDDAYVMRRKMTTFIETRHLIITVPQLSDMDYLTGLMMDPEVMKYIGSGGPRTIEQIQERLDKAISHYQKHGFSVGCVFDKQTNDFVGRAGLFYLEYNDTQPEIEVGYTLHRVYWGKGYATELTKAIIAWGFQHLAIEKLVGVTFPENTASRRVLEKAGMHYVGMMHCYNVDAAKYEITANEFAQAHKN